MWNVFPEDLGGKLSKEIYVMIAFNFIEKSIMSREYLVFKTGELWNCSPEGNGKDCRSGDLFIPNIASYSLNMKSALIPYSRPPVP